MKKNIGCVTIAALMLTSCADLCQIKDPATGQPVPGQFQGSIADRAKPKALPSARLLTSVKTTSCDGFDRVVFEFSGDEAPGYFAEYIDKPVRQCGSGNVVKVAGEGWLQIRMAPASAHTDEGQATITERNRILDYPNLQQLVDTCDFEGNVTWVLGLKSPNSYRVVELTDPPRLIVDVKHQ
ncbi:hypothetical protein V2O64_11975 [Verrucomicrobiaceae bacterium 227]